MALLNSSSAPIPAVAVAPPPTTAGSRGFIPAQSAPEKSAKAGGLKIAVIASIQAIYAKEEQKKMMMQSQGMQKAMQPPQSGNS